MELVPGAVSSVLDILADKFGTTVAALWEIMVKQAYVDAVQVFFVLAVLIVATILSVKNWDRIAAKKDYNGDQVLAIVIGAILVAMWLAMILVLVPHAIGTLINPEYWALKQILELLGG